MARTWREGRFTSMFDFPLGFAIADVFCRGESPARLAATVTNDRRYPDATQLVTLVDNHDLPRLKSLCGGDEEKVKQALSFLLAMRGVPSITWGTEVGLDGAKEPDNRRSMRFVEHPFRAHLAQAMRQRQASAALRDGVAVPVEVSASRAVIARVAPDGQAVNVVIDQGRVSLAPAPARGPREIEAWRRGGPLVEISFTGEGAVVGSGPELGDWDRAKARRLPVTLSLPQHGVFEFKRLLEGEFEAGANRVLLVRGPAQVVLD